MQFENENLSTPTIEPTIMEAIKRDQLEDPMCEDLRYEILKDKRHNFYIYLKTGYEVIKEDGSTYLLIKRLRVKFCISLTILHILRTLEP